MLCRGDKGGDYMDIWGAEERAGGSVILSFVPHKTRECALMCTAWGPVEWSVGMWECFVVLSWWEEGVCGILVYGQLTGFAR
jgi:hypothetical protein